MVFMCPNIQAHYNEAATHCSYNDLTIAAPVIILLQLEATVYCSYKDLTNAAAVKYCSYNDMTIAV